MSDKKEKAVNLEDLLPDETASSLSSLTVKNESKLMELDELENEELNPPPLNTKKMIEGEAVRLKKKFVPEEKKLQKKWLLRKIPIGPKKLNTKFFIKSILPLSLAYQFWQMRIKLLSQNFEGDMLREYAFNLSAEPLQNFLFFMTFVSAALGIYFMTMEKTFVFTEMHFVLSADGIEGVDSLTPVSTRFYRRKMKWHEIEKVKLNDLAKIPSVNLIYRDRSIIELPLYISNIDDFKRGLDEFCPDDNPFRLIINKFKNS